MHWDCDVLGPWNLEQLAIPAFQKKLELGTYAFPSSKIHLSSKRERMFSSAEIVAPPFYTRGGANSHLYGMLVS